MHLHVFIKCWFYASQLKILGSLDICTLRQIDLSVLGLCGGRRTDPPILLPREIVRRRQLQNVSCRSGEIGKGIYIHVNHKIKRLAYIN